VKIKTCITILLLAISTTLFADELRRHTNRGTAALRRGDTQAALEHFTAALESSPTSNEAKFNRALALAATGNTEEAETVLADINFEKNEQNIMVLNLRAKISEMVGDLFAQNDAQPDFAKARTAYEKARALYSQSLDLNPRTANHQTYIKARIENLSNKIRNLPEDEQNENGDGENNDQNNENEQNGDGDNQSGQNQDNNNENEESEEERNRQDEEERRRERERQEREAEERSQDAVRLIELFSDDASELKRPPAQTAAPAAGGREW